MAASPTQKQRTADAIRTAIQAGVYPVGKKLPGVRPLAQQYGVAYNTMREALAILTSEGLLETIPQSGSVVLAGHRPVDLVPTEHGRLLPVSPSTGLAEAVTVETCPAPPTVARVLQVPADEQLLLRRSTHIVDGAPWGVVETYLPLALVDLYPRLRHPDVAVADELEGISADGEHRAWMTAQESSPELARLLSGDCSVLSWTRVALRGGEPWWCQITSLRGDRVRVLHTPGAVADRPGF
ncbi:GntR family transcriptional regulator [Kitasatospora sp. NPDC056783]|uniref:GntR family transcriptional regulator n=1 Tax=Kitasatospora sp. NPDC056783 TaxID=3345943 RepID=UPI0036AE99E1